MREYGIISPKFWIGKTGRKLRAHPYAQRVALYLMTAPNADMTGVYYCPLSSILNDVGSPSNAPLKPLESPFEAPCEGYKNPFEGVRAALSVLEELGFCVYDVENEYVFVVEMARWQVAESLKSTDNRVKGIKKYVESMPDGLRQRFINRYNDAFSLGLQVSPIEAPYKPLRSQEQEQEQEQEQKKEVGGGNAPTPSVDEFGLAGEVESSNTKTKKPKAITHPLDLESIPDDYTEYCQEVRPDLVPARVFAAFKAYWTKGKGKGTLKSDKNWFQSWMNWVKKEDEARTRNTKPVAVEEFSDDRYANAMTPDGSLNWD